MEYVWAPDQSGLRSTIRNWALPFLAGLWDAVGFSPALFAQLTKVHLGLKGHLKATNVRHVQLQPQTWPIGDHRWVGGERTKRELENQWL